MMYELIELNWRYYVYFKTSIASTSSEYCKLIKKYEPRILLEIVAKNKVF